MAVVDINACHFVVVELSHKKINDASRHINLTMRFKFKNCLLCLLAAEAPLGFDIDGFEPLQYGNFRMNFLSFYQVCQAMKF